MSNSTIKQLCFPPSAGFTVRANFEGGGLSSDLGPMLLRSLDRQIGLTKRLSAATMSRFEHAAATRDIYRASQALVEQFIAGFAQPPAALVRLMMNVSFSFAH